MSLPFLKSEPGAEPVVVEARFAVSPERVFQAWSNPQEMSQWFGTSATIPEAVEIDFRIGGKWRFSFKADEGVRDSLLGEYLDIETGRRLVFSWTHQRESSTGEVTVTKPSRVTVIFEREDIGTRIRLIHESIVQEQGRVGVASGWKQSLHRLLGHLVESTH